MSDEFDFSDLELDWLNEPSASGGAPAFPGTEDAGTPASETDIDKILAEIKGTAGHTPRTQPRPAQPRPQSAQPRLTSQVWSVVLFLPDCPLLNQARWVLLPIEWRVCSS